MARILALYGSPRRGGTTETIMDAFIEEARARGHEVEEIRLCSVRILPCTECGACNLTGTCTLVDSMNSLYGKVRDAYHIVIAVPVFFSSVPSQVKAFIDRFQCWWVSRERLGREPRPRGGLLVPLVAGARGSEQDLVCVRRTLAAFADTTGFSMGSGVFIKAEDSRDVPRKSALREMMRAVLEEIEG